MKRHEGAMCQVAFRKRLARTGFSDTLKGPAQTPPFRRLTEKFYFQGLNGRVRICPHLFCQRRSKSPCGRDKLLWWQCLGDIGVKHQALINVLQRQGKSKIGL